MQSPVLVLAFRRPEPTRRVLEAIATAGVRKLYVAIDGPRPGRAEDEARCAEVFDLVNETQWAEEVLIRRRALNMGCRDATVDGIDWFFSHEAEGIVLEDDCLPAADFFPFCAKMLELFRDDDRVWLVSGNNHLRAWRPARSDYFFGDGNTWGWATWRSAWSERDMAMTTWSDPAARECARRFLGPLGWMNLAPYYARSAAGEIDTWDYQWSWTRASHGKLSVLPSRNLVSNIGYGPDATHTHVADRLSALPTGQLDTRALRPPPAVVFDRGFQFVLVARQEALARTRSLGAKVLGRLGLLERVRDGRSLRSVHTSSLRKHDDVTSK